MKAEVIKVYVPDEDNFKLVEATYKINDKEVSEEEFLEEIKHADKNVEKVSIIHRVEPLRNQGFGNCYGWQIELERGVHYYYLSYGRFSTSWQKWDDIGMTGTKFDYDYVALNSVFDDFSLVEIIRDLLDIEFVSDYLNIIDLIKKYSDEFLSEEEIKAEISEKYDKEEDEIDTEMIENYLKEKYSDKVEFVINIIDEEDNIHSVII
ncbi:hypothetical protein ACO3UB_08520 (plasmid) [Methanocaldococcus sp. 16A]